MGKLKTIFKDTAIYGLSSIIGRFLNYLLVPLYTAQFSAASGAYGIITNVYAYVALVMVLLTFGMETTYFRFTNKTHTDSQTVYGTTLISVGTVSLLFAVIVMLFLDPISRLMHYGNHPSYVGVMAITVAIDAFLCIPFAHLRQQKKALKFAALKLLNIAMSILLNLIYFYWMDGKDVGYVFYINLVCTAMLAVCLITEYTGFRWKLDTKLLRTMLSYSWPILIFGIAGILNQTADKILFPKVYPGADANVQLGIYGAVVKIAMIMALITQAFRYAYEPFVFGNSREKDNKETYAKGMKYFVIFTLLAFLCVMAYMNVLRYIIKSDYWDGLKVVPIVMAAEMMMGIYFNLSFWYKLTDKTIWGAIFSGIGCVVLIAINFIFVPKYGYMACAWGGFAGYGTCMVLSYFVGQKKAPIPYDLKSAFMYFAVAIILYYAQKGIHIESTVLTLVVNTTLLLLFFAFICWREKDLVRGVLGWIRKRKG